MHVLLTKADKLKRGPAMASLHKVRKSLSDTPQNSAQLFSSLKKTGIDEAHTRLDTWFQLATGEDPIAITDDRPR